ncbi:thioesterase [Streptomyces sp. ISL-10]|uniref:thioesterase II family protein n=1 Tax=Streptomyces sp. ISL-10 TaxID=2819172 RepID=UPI001BEAFCD5|nr:alpha/beta fold hydrolase [Streptomyces sp. ISL-10]MBT2364795.1 thioesterase [Streptomyces sp. ISL-10]
MENRRTKLICLHHAGGSPSVFEPWVRAAPEELDVIALELPRSQDSATRRLYGTTEELVPVLAEDVAEKAACDDYVLFGQSMGGLLAYLVTRHFHERMGPLPEALVVAAYAAPHIPWRDPTDPDAPDGELVRRLHDIGGVPDWLAAHPEWLSPFLGLVRDDARLCGSYRHVPQSSRLPVPVRVFGGNRDILVPEQALRAWAEISDDVTVDVLDGGHFLVSEDFGHLRKYVFGLAMNGRTGVG